MIPPTSISRAPLATALLLAVALPATATTADEWSHLRSLRDRMQSGGGVEVVDFVQTFVPAGFTTGERESGRMALSLPHCMRWDYATPYDKSFLVCGERAWFWNGGETSGRRFTVDPDNEPGLDLLRLDIEILAERYSADVAREEEDFVELTIQPAAAPAGEASAVAAHPIRDATITLDPRAGRLTSVTYRDAEGNTTRFELSGHRPAAEASFAPPEIEWVED